MTARASLRSAAACVGLAACAPLAELRPASGSMPGKSFELGAAVVNLGTRPYVKEEPATTGQLWFSGDASRWVTLTAITAFDASTATGGGALRVNALRLDRLAAGVEGQVGGGWFALVLPVAARAVDQTWLYASPRLGTLGRHLSFGLPVGISARVVGGLALRGEVQVSWEDFAYYNRRTHLALGVAHQW